MKRKRILAISYLFPNTKQPNHGIFVLNRLVAMSRYADVTVINPIPHSPIHGFIEKYKVLADIPEKEQLRGLSVFHPRFFSIPGHFKSVEIKSYKRAVVNIIEEIGFDFDLIDLHWTFPDLPTGDYLSTKYSIPFNITLRGMEAFHLQDTDIRQHIVKKYLKKSDKVISLSNEMAKTADDIAQTSDRTTVIRNGVDTDKFFFRDMHTCREELGLDHNKRIVLGVGAIIHRKGFDLVIKALASLLQDPEFKDLIFYILGSEGAEGDFRVELKKYVNAHGLESHVVFQGAVPNEQLIAWYNAVDVFCLSSRGEGSPNVLTEALACGTPAIAAEVGSVPEIMMSEINLGKTFESENLGQLIDALRNVLTNDYDRPNCARNFNKYTWDWCAKNIFNLIGE